MTLTTLRPEMQGRSKLCPIDPYLSSLQKFLQDGYGPGAFHAARVDYTMIHDAETVVGGLAFWFPGARCRGRASGGSTALAGEHPRLTNYELWATQIRRLFKPSGRL